MNSPSPLGPLPKGEGCQIQSPSPQGEKFRVRVDLGGVVLGGFGICGIDDRCFLLFYKIH